MGIPLNSLDRIFTRPADGQPLDDNQIKQNLKDKYTSSPAVTSLILAWMAAKSENLADAIKIQHSPEGETFWFIGNEQGEVKVHLQTDPSACSLWSRIKHGWKMLTNEDYKTRFNGAVESLISAVHTGEARQAEQMRMMEEARDAEVRRVAALNSHISLLEDEIAGLNNDLLNIEQTINGHNSDIIRLLQENENDIDSRDSIDAKLPILKQRKELFSELVGDNIRVFSPSQELLLTSFMGAVNIENTESNRSDIKALIRVDFIGGNHTEECLVEERKFISAHKEKVDERELVEERINGRNLAITEKEGHITRAEMQKRGKSEWLLDKQAALEVARNSLNPQP